MHKSLKTVYSNAIAIRKNDDLKNYSLNFLQQAIIHIIMRLGQKEVGDIGTKRSLSFCWFTSPYYDIPRHTFDMLVHTIYSVPYVDVSHTLQRRHHITQHKQCNLFYKLTVS